MLYKVTHRYYLGMLSFLNEEFAKVRSEYFSLLHRWQLE